jgi:MarR family transcriptional regulator, organic hydroperoxide resistance regulator
MSMRQLYSGIGETAMLLQLSDQATLRPYGLSPLGYIVLERLERAESLRQVELATGLLLDPSTITRTLDKLQHSGLVRRAIDPHDRRAVRVGLTDKGRERAALARQALEQAGEQRGCGLSPDELAALLCVLDKLSAHLRADLRP